MEDKMKKIFNIILWIRMDDTNYIEHLEDLSSYCYDDKTEILTRREVDCGGIEFDVGRDYGDYSWLSDLRKSNILLVSNISILSCFENAFSSDQIGQLLNANESAKYWMSLRCGANVSASDLCLLKSSNGIVSICSLINKKTSDNSSFNNLLLSTISSKFLPISKNINSGEINSNFFEREFNLNISNALPLDRSDEYILFVSTIMNILDYSSNESINRFDNALFVLSESSLTSSSINLDLETINLSLANLSNSGFIILAIAKDSLILDNFLRSDSNSSGMDIVISAMLKGKEIDYINVTDNVGRENKKKGSNRMVEPNPLIADYSNCNNSKYVNLSVGLNGSSRVAEWLLQSVDSRCPSGFVGSIPTSGVLDNSSGNNENSGEVCYIEEWKLFKELTNEDEVMTLNATSGEKAWQKPMERQEFEHNDDMYKIILEDWSELVVSPEHRVYVKNYKNSNSSAEINLMTLPLNFSGVYCFNNSNITAFYDSKSLAGTLNSQIPKCSEEINLSSMKCLSLVINNLCSDEASLRTSPFSKDFGDNLTSCPNLVRKGSSPICTFSSLQNSKNFDSHQKLEEFLRNKNFILFNDRNYKTSFGELGSEVQGGFNVAFSKGRICFEDFFNRSAVVEHFQDYGNHNSSAFESRLAMADFAVNNNVITNFNSHNVNDKDKVYKDFYKSRTNKDLSNFELIEISELYTNIIKNKLNASDLVFLDDELNEVRVLNISKEDYSGKIYDVDVGNDIVLVRRVEDLGDSENSDKKENGFKQNGEPSQPNGFPLLNNAYENGKYLNISVDSLKGASVAEWQMQPAETRLSTTGNVGSSPTHSVFNVNDKCEWFGCLGSLMKFNENSCLNISHNNIYINHRLVNLLSTYEKVENET